ncbi:unnamed protein product [Pieris brassicae]|uniref:Uncharacterized protein n=1 Tax=Pieris brassicae TaxID=7116 RepID=A0A9P0TVL2_PIEBR|nr:unnamed protein product [Pieris brassicae]
MNNSRKWKISRGGGERLPPVLTSEKNFLPDDTILHLSEYLSFSDFRNFVSSLWPREDECPRVVRTQVRTLQSLKCWRTHRKLKLRCVRQQQQLKQSEDHVNKRQRKRQIDSDNVLIEALKMRLNDKQQPLPLLDEDKSFLLSLVSKIRGDAKGDNTSYKKYKATLMHNDKALKYLQQVSVLKVLINLNNHL